MDVNLRAIGGAFFKGCQNTSMPIAQMFKVGSDFQLNNGCENIQLDGSLGKGAFVFPIHLANMKGI